MDSKCVRRFLCVASQRKIPLHFMQFIVGSYIIPFPSYIIFALLTLSPWSVSMCTHTQWAKSIQHKRQHNLLITKRNEQVKHENKKESLHTQCTIICIRCICLVLYFSIARWLAFSSLNRLVVWVNTEQ